MRWRRRSPETIRPISAASTGIGRMASASSAVELRRGGDELRRLARRRPPAPRPRRGAPPASGRGRRRSGRAPVPVVRSFIALTLFSAVTLGKTHPERPPCADQKLLDRADRKPHRLADLRVGPFAVGGEQNRCALPRRQARQYRRLRPPARASRRGGRRPPPRGRRSPSASSRPKKRRTLRRRSPSMARLTAIRVR